MSYYTKITTAGLAAITAALNNDSKVPITYMAFGDGSGSVPEPNENATSLVNEVYRVGVNKVEVHNKNPNWLVCEAIIPSAVGSFNIREVALYDSTGNTMLAVASYPPTYKPSIEEGAAKIQTIRIILQVDNTGYFELIIDPDIVLATVESVNQAKQEILADIDNRYKNPIGNVNSINELLSLEDNFLNRTMRVVPTNALYSYDPDRISENDGFYVLNGWVLIGYKDRLLATLAGLKGDQSDEYHNLKKLLDFSSIFKLPIDLCNLTIHTRNITAVGDLKFIGRGGIKLFSGTKGTLITSNYNLIVDGDIELDQNKDNNLNSSATSESDCCIKHSGDELIIKSARVKPSTSINIVSRAKKKIVCENSDIQGGIVNFFAVPGNSAKVTLSKNLFKGATLYDNVQILNGKDILIDGNTSSYSQRSGIVVNNTTGQARIVNNLCFGNKIDSVNQGGWGIVCSINTFDSLVSNNIVYGNQRGGITIDVYPETGSLIDNRIIVSNNCINGIYEGNYATTGISLNGARYAVVTGNTIYKVSQGVHTERAHNANIHGNILQDISGYFVQLYISNDAMVVNNRFDGCTVNGLACVRFSNSHRFICQGNSISNLSGTTGSVFRVDNSTDWLISENLISRSVAGSGYILQALTSGVTGGTFTRNKVKGLINAAWQWVVMSDDLAQVDVFDNIFDTPGVNYIYKGANITAGDNLVNGSKNIYAEPPTSFKSRIGQTAIIGNLLKHYDGTNWI